jgi:UDP-N-acetyl-D-mannosaminuronate dehydrogenase
MRIGIVGLGYVGLPLAVAFCEAGPDVPGLPHLGLRRESPEDADRTRIVTANPDLDVERLVGKSALLMDFRGVTRGNEAPNLVRP